MLVGTKASKTVRTDENFYPGLDWRPPSPQLRENSSRDMRISRDRQQRQQPTLNSSDRRRRTTLAQAATTWLTPRLKQMVGTSCIHYPPAPEQQQRRHTDSNGSRAAQRRAPWTLARLSTREDVDGALQTPNKSGSSNAEQNSKYE